MLAQKDSYITHPVISQNKQAQSNNISNSQYSNNIVSSPSVKYNAATQSQSQVVANVVSQSQPRITAVQQPTPEIATQVVQPPQRKIVTVTKSMPEIVPKVVSQSNQKFITMPQSHPQVVKPLQPKIITLAQPKSQPVAQIIPSIQPKVINIAQRQPQVLTRAVQTIQPRIITVTKSKPQVMTRIISPPEPKIIPVAMPKPQVVARPQPRMINIAQQEPQVVAQPQPRMINITKQDPQAVARPQPRILTVDQQEPQVVTQPQPRMINITKQEPQAMKRPQPRMITVDQQEPQVVAQPQPRMINITKQEPQVVTQQQTRMVTITKQEPQVFTQQQPRILTVDQSQSGTELASPSQQEVASVAFSSIPIKLQTIFKQPQEIYTEGQSQGQASTFNNSSTINQSEIVEVMPQKQTLSQQQVMLQQSPSAFPAFLYPQSQNTQMNGQYYNVKNIGEQHFISLEYLCNMNISPEIPQCMNYRIPTPVINIQAMPRIVMPKKVLPKIIKNRGIHDFELLKLMNGISLIELRKLKKSIKRIYSYLKNTRTADNNLNQITSSPYTINSNKDEISCTFNPQLPVTEGNNANLCYKMLCIGEDCNVNNEKTVLKESNTETYPECLDDNANAPCVRIERNEAKEQNVSYQEDKSKTFENEEVATQNTTNNQIISNDEQVDEQNVNAVDASSLDNSEKNSQIENVVLYDSGKENLESNNSEEKINNIQEKGNVENSTEVISNSNGFSSNINIGNLRKNDEITIKSEIKIGQKNYNEGNEKEIVILKEAASNDEASKNTISNNNFSSDFHVRGFSKGRKVDLSDNTNKIESSSIHYINNDQVNKEDESKVVYQIRPSNDDNMGGIQENNSLVHLGGSFDASTNNGNSGGQELITEWENKENIQKLRKEEFDSRLYRLLAKLKEGEFCSNQKDKDICVKLYSFLIKNSYEDGKIHEILPIREDINTERYKDLFEDDIDELILKSVLSHKIYKEMMIKRLREESEESTSNASLENNLSVNFTGIRKGCDYSNGYLNAEDCIKVMKMSDLIKGSSYDDECLKILNNQMNGSFGNTNCSLVGSSNDNYKGNRYFYLSDLI